MASAELQRYAALRARALAVMPESKLNTVTVAVFHELEDQDSQISELDDEDFLWIRCSMKTTLSIVHKNCIKAWADGIAPSDELELFFREAPVQMANTVGVLNTDGDDLVLLSAKLVSVAQTSVNQLG
ncbi:hypothetical protein Q9L58_009074 [Maublancomyces gigas]|uniref:Uncharacterized protein n=1 Tax=Discina gigas TaxID=1032678 RepID=A0ABR3G846_9PEZI